MRKNALSTLVVAVIAILLLGYYYNDPLVISGSFHTLRVVLYLIVPLLLNFFYFHIPWTDLGIAPPTTTFRIKLFLGFILMLIPIIVSLVHFSPDYLDAYPMYRNDRIHPLLRFSHFLVFTLSTLIGWEFLLRGFFLFGLRYILENQFRLKSALAIRLSILWVCTFEVLYHFVKPDLEALGMLIASPILSWLAFKTKSFVIPMAVHLYIELIFILVVIFL